VLEGRSPFPNFRSDMTGTSSNGLGIAQRLPREALANITDTLIVVAQQLTVENLREISLPIRFEVKQHIDQVIDEFEIRHR